MGDVRNRLEHLEQALGRSTAPNQPGGLAEEIRAIDENIARLDAEIAEERAKMSPEEIQENRLSHEAYMASLDGLCLDETIAALDEKIAELKEKINERRDV